MLQIDPMQSHWRATSCVLRPSGEPGAERVVVAFAPPPPLIDVGAELVPAVAFGLLCWLGDCSHATESTAGRSSRSSWRASVSPARIIQQATMILISRLGGARPTKRQFWFTRSCRSPIASFCSSSTPTTGSTCVAVAAKWRDGGKLAIRQTSLPACWASPARGAKDKVGARGATLQCNGAQHSEHTTYCMPLAVSSLLVRFVALLVAQTACFLCGCGAGSCCCTGEQHAHNVERARNIRHFQSAIHFAAHAHRPNGTHTHTHALKNQRQIHHLRPTLKLNTNNI